MHEVWKKASASDQPGHDSNAHASVPEGGEGEATTIELTPADVSHGEHVGTARKNVRYMFTNPMYKQ